MRTDLNNENRQVDLPGDDHAEILEAAIGIYGKSSGPDRAGGGAQTFDGETLSARNALFGEGLRLPK